jgi:hypothetical protein
LLSRGELHRVGPGSRGRREKREDQRIELSHLLEHLVRDRLQLRPGKYGEFKLDQEPVVFESK